MRKVFLSLVITLLLLAIPVGYGLSNAQVAGWNKYEGNPIMFYGPPGSWDDFNVYAVDVMFFDKNNADPADDEYYMWYSGTSFTRNSKDIGFATSKDGINWSRYVGNPVIRNGDFGYWDYERINAPTVLYDRQEGVWKMWYAGYSSYFAGFGIGYATSSNAINWQKYPTNAVTPALVFEATGIADDFDGYSVFSPEVLKINGKYHMWYAGNGGRFAGNQIGYAYSDDGIHWTRYTKPGTDIAEPVLPVGGPGAWDEGETVSPSVIQVGDTLFMYYQGSNIDQTLTGIGRAWSTDGGKTWTKDPNNPLLRGSGAGAWDFNRLYYPSATVNNRGELYLWFHARSRNSDLTPFKLGLAFGENATPIPPTATPTLAPGVTPSPTPSDPGFIMLPIIQRQ
ncbi:MAG: hypothetical protein BroJett021_11550 [Chloroflexota bacterium]|jgi:predicted GH43/DUF377 family glycosyl hydrolase|nr:hypothetical protein [Caldilinea sp.]GIK72167.1 MAG: hypothetical protein BroJett021_11550 [Chloroflexota bacterium]